MKKTKLIIFDLWQTLADVPVKPCGEIYELSKSKKDISSFIHDLKKSEVFLENKCIDITLGNFLQKQGMKNIERCVERWKNISQEAFLLPETEDLISNLKEDFSLALCTNTDKFGFENFKFKPFLKNFDYIYASYQHGVAKPDTYCWFNISEKFHNLNFEESLMVGDNYAQDIRPAKELGLMTYDVTNHQLSKVTEYII